MANPRPEEQKFNCMECGQKFQSREQLDDHMRNSHPEQQERGERGGERKRPAA